MCIRGSKRLGVSAREMDRERDRETQWEELLYVYNGCNEYCNNFFNGYYRLI